MLLEGTTRVSGPMHVYYCIYQLMYIAITESVCVSTVEAK